MSGDYSFIIDNFTWSFSRLNSFHQCPYQFKLAYIDCVKGENNFFGEYGTLCHNILETFCKKEAEIYELSSLFEKNYSGVVLHKAPPNKFVNLNESYYQQAKDYFDSFSGFKYEVLDVEKEVLFDINNINIKGYVDLILKDEDGELHIVDHKSSDVKTPTSEKAKEYWKQMYLYSIGVKKIYGKYPKQLHINAFRKQQWFTIDFDESQIKKVEDWVINTVNMIKEEDKFLPLSSGYFCNFLCNFRNGLCEYKPQEI